MQKVLFVLQALAIILVQGAWPRPRPRPPTMADEWSVLPKISGGQNAAKHEFPFMVRVNVYYHNSNSYGICGGTILSTTKILTAAHCVPDTNDDGNKLKKIEVVAGAHDLRDGNDPDVQTVTASSATKHGSYNTQTHQEDVAILTLGTALKLNNYVKTVNLASGSDTYAGKDVIAMGWGLTDRKTDSEVLQKVTLTVLDKTQCNHDQTKTICTKDKSGGIKSTCSGDSGGPLVINENGSYKQIGIVSGGRGNCGTNGKLTIWTRVTAYSDFISRNK